MMSYVGLVEIAIQTILIFGAFFVIGTFLRGQLMGQHVMKMLIFFAIVALMAYLRGAQRCWPGEPCEGILLYPVAANRVDLRYTIEGHPVRIWTLDLAQPWPEVRSALLSLIGSPVSVFGPFQKGDVFSTQN